MKKLSQLLLIVFSFVLMLSCNKNEDAKPTNTTTQLTTEQKLNLLNNYRWLITKPSAVVEISTQADRCSTQNYISFIAVENENGLYLGDYYTVFFTDVEGVCIQFGEPNIQDYSYNPTTNTISIKNSRIDTSAHSTIKTLGSQPTELPITITDTTLTFGGITYHKGNLKILK